MKLSHADHLKGENACATLRPDRPYERLDISGVKGLTDAQRATSRALGAVEGAPSAVPGDAAQNM
jgi:hypothetical protein